MSQNLGSSKKFVNCLPVNSINTILSLFSSVGVLLLAFTESIYNLVARVNNTGFIS